MNKNAALFEIRKARKLTIAHMSNIMGISNSHYRNIESGRYPLPPTVLTTLREVKHGRGEVWESYTGDMFLILGGTAEVKRVSYLSKKYNISDNPEVLLNNGTRYYAMAPEYVPCTLFDVGTGAKRLQTVSDHRLLNLIDWIDIPDTIPQEYEWGEKRKWMKATLAAWARRIY